MDEPGGYSKSIFLFFCFIRKPFELSERGEAGGFWSQLFMDVIFNMGSRRGPSDVVGNADREIEIFLYVGPLRGIMMIVSGAL